MASAAFPPGDLTPVCGIVGITLPQDCPAEAFDRMVDALAHRGPDGRGVFRDEWVALGSRRLAVQDTSRQGAQPMVSPDGAVRIVYNGECYNHLALRAHAPGWRWRSTCDTETLLALYEAEGIGFVERLNGMFALAVHDARAGRLYLVRDRLGIKPLYYCFDGRRLAFASELRALRAWPGFDRTLDRRAVAQYALLGTIPAPLSIHAGTRKLGAGELAEFDVRGARLRVRRWWKAADFVRPETPPPARAEKVLRQHEDRLEELLGDAVRARTLADVPLGCFLSGGLDSSAVATMLARAGTGQARTFCMGFEQARYDESPYAARVARRLGTEHTSGRVTADEALALVGRMGRFLDEPFADASAIPTLMLCEQARRQVTVALSGDGGDELFLGYDRYRWLASALRWGGAVPGGVRRAGAALLGALPHDRLARIGRGMGWPSARAAYPWVFIGWNAAWAGAVVRRDLDFGRHFLHRHVAEAGAVHPVRAAAFADVRHYLADDLLVKVDRASMWHGLEVRVPFLDHRLVEFALGLPAWITWGAGEPKRLLRRMVARHLPERWFARPKQGFAVPLHAWLRGSLGPLMREALAPSELARHGLFDARVVERTIARHLSGRWNHERPLWTLLAFQLWYAENHR
jgi:asparagine synthase (glutamine-hydrolysing)